MGRLRCYEYANEGRPELAAPGRVRDGLPDHDPVLRREVFGVTRLDVEGVEKLVHVAAGLDGPDRCRCMLVASNNELEELWGSQFAPACREGDEEALLLGEEPGGVFLAIGFE